MKRNHQHSAIVFGLTLSFLGGARAASAQEGGPSSESASGAPAAEAPVSENPPGQERAVSQENAPSVPGAAGPGEAGTTGGAQPEGAAPVVDPDPPPRAPESPLAPEVSPVAAPPELVPEPAPDPNTLPFTYHQIHFDLQVSFGPGFLTDAAADPFTSTKTFALVGARLGVAPWSAGRFAFAALLDGGYGSMGGDARGTRTSLELGLLGVGLEARYHFHHQFYGYARLSPGAAFIQRTVMNPGLPLHGAEWAFALGGHAGVALRLAGSSDGRVREPRVWLFAEAGYRFTESRASTLKPGPDSAVDAELEAPGLSLSGPDLSIGVGLTF